MSESGVFLGTQELGEDVPDLPLDAGAELTGDFREGEREAVVVEFDHGRVGRKGVREVLIVILIAIVIVVPPEGRNGGMVSEPKPLRAPLAD